MYKVRGERLFWEVDYLVTYLVVACDEDTAVRTDQCVTHQKGLNATITLVLDIRGVNIVMST